jgi:RimJ/RimL family protein N-acetyltransferase
VSRLVLVARDAVRMIRDGHSRRLVDSLKTRFDSVSPSLGLARDLAVPHQAPAAKLPVEVRPLGPGEELDFLALDDPDLSDAAAHMILQQRRLLESQAGTCWIAVDRDGRHAYMQCLILPEHNDRLRSLFGDLFPRLRPGEALLEGAYTPPDFRGQGIMAHAMALIAESAADQGVRSVVTFVGDDNIASLKGCKKAGFWPYTRRLEIYHLGRRQIRYAPMPPGTPYAFDEPPAKGADPPLRPIPTPRPDDAVAARSANSSTSR